MTNDEYAEMFRKREALGNDWSVLLEEIIDDLIESGNGLDDLTETTERAFRLRDILNREMR